MRWSGSRSMHASTESLPMLGREDEAQPSKVNNLAPSLPTYVHPIVYAAQRLTSRTLHGTLSSPSHRTEQPT